MRRLRVIFLQLALVTVVVLGTRRSEAEVLAVGPGIAATAVLAWGGEGGPVLADDSAGPARDHRERLPVGLVDELDGDADGDDAPDAHPRAPVHAAALLPARPRCAWRGAHCEVREPPALMQCAVIEPPRARLFRLHRLRLPSPATDARA
jgi:hypothetical protein